MKTIQTITDIINEQGRDSYREQIKTLRQNLEQFALTVSNDAAYRKNPADTVTALVAAFGLDSLTEIVATLVNRSAWDGRLDNTVTEWARNCPNAWDEEAAVRLYISCDRVHKCHLNQIAHAVIDYKPEEPKPTEDKPHFRMSNLTMDVMMHFERLGNRAEDYTEDQRYHIEHLAYCACMGAREDISSWSRFCYLVSKEMDIDTDPEAITEYYLWTIRSLDNLPIDETLERLLNDTVEEAAHNDHINHSNYTTIYDTAWNRLHPTTETKSAPSEEEVDEVVGEYLSEHSEEVFGDIPARFEAVKEAMVENDGYGEEDFFGCDFVEKYDEETHIFSLDGREYLVLTEDEAIKAASDAILDSLWAFNSDFILSHCEQFDHRSVREFEEAVKAVSKMQETLCENATPIVKALITNIDEFVEDAIEADGRGHFLSMYDGEEYEVGDWFVYRLN